MSGRRRGRRGNYGRTLQVSYRRKSGRKVSYRERDRGEPGRGLKIPPGGMKHKGSMDRVAKEMGYATATEVPDGEIPAYVRRLVRTYGERSTRGKIQLMINDRKSMSSRNPIKRKFLDMRRSLTKQYGGGGWTPASRRR